MSSPPLPPPNLLRSQTEGQVEGKQPQRAQPQSNIFRLSATSPIRPLQRRILPRRTCTMPARTRSLPSGSSVIKTSMQLPRMITNGGKRLFDLSAMAMDDASNSATSFLSMSLSTHSHHSRGRTNIQGSNAEMLMIMGTNPTELCVDHLDDFVSRILPPHLQGNCKEVLSQIQHDVTVCWQLQSKGEPVTQSTLSDIELGLASILEYTPSLPANIVVHLHSYRGLLHLQRDSTAAAAVESFTRALWLQSHRNRLNQKSCSEVSPTTKDNNSIHHNDHFDHLWNMAVTEHRLGVAYGRSGKYLKAIDQMEHAILSYAKAGVGISEPCFQAAKEDLHEFQEAHQISLLRNSGRPMRTNMLVGSRHGHRNSLRSSTNSNATSGSRSRQSSLKSSLTSNNMVTEEARLALALELELQDSFVY